jgi:hypothetical protein
MIRSKRMNLARRIARMGRKDKTFAGKPEYKRAFGRPKRR